MKTNSLTVSASVPRKRVQVSNLFTWAKVHALVLKLRGKLPDPWKIHKLASKIRDLEIERLLKQEKSKRAILTRETVSGMKDMFN